MGDRHWRSKYRPQILRCRSSFPEPQDFLSYLFTALSYPFPTEMIIARGDKNDGQWVIKLTCDGLELVLLAHAVKALARGDAYMHLAEHLEKCVVPTDARTRLIQLDRGRRNEERVLSALREELGQSDSRQRLLPWLTGIRHSTRTERRAGVDLFLFKQHGPPAKLQITSSEMAKGMFRQRGHAPDIVAVAVNVGNDNQHILRKIAEAFLHPW